MILEKNFRNSEKNVFISKFGDIILIPQIGKTLKTGLILPFIITINLILSVVNGL